MNNSIERLDPSTARALLPDLIDLLCDAVDSGASVGFLPPLSPQEAEAYWREVIVDLSQTANCLWIARQEGRTAGSVQLQPSPKANGSHRAEVAKLMVHTAHRRHGIGRALMAALEQEALKLGRTTLCLDTRQGDPSEVLYTSMGYIKAGTIPQYARSADGSLHPTVFYYKLLDMGKER